MNACFFDLDGTLADTREGLAATVNHTRADLGLAPLATEEVLLHVGRGAKVLLAESIPERADEGAKLMELFMSHYSEHALDNVALYPGVRRTLEELRARGWLLGVNTAKPAHATHLILEHLGIARFFGSAVVAGGDCAEMKPSALPLRQCASLLRGHRLSAYDWMVGDNWTDLECAANAGVRAAFCTFGFGFRREARYTISINRMDELLRHLKPEED